MWTLTIFIILFLPKFTYILFYLIGFLLGRIGCGFLKKIFKPIALIFSAITLTTVLYGSLITVWTPQVKSDVLEFDNLPESFNNLRIVQISDFHLGSLSGKPEFVRAIVAEINKLNPDLILFTGDLVNSLAAEVEPFKRDLSLLKATYGVFSVLGNHDYGDYYRWESEELKKKNLEYLKEVQNDCGWRLLNNDYAILKQGNDSIAIIGVENWGDYPFPKYGDLNKAYKELTDSTFKILLSHNPVHWRSEVLKKSNIDLTLSGHTHAMQFKISLFGYKWSPAELRYKDYDGLYSHGEQKLYVNSGLGFVGVPIRVGVKPEITLITLKKEKYYDRFSNN